MAPNADAPLAAVLPAVGRADGLLQADAGAAATGAPPYAALLFAATFVSLLGVFLTLHGAAAYALLVWEGAAGVAAWLYVHPAVGAFFFAAAAFQVPLAAHLWGDPLAVRRRTGRALRALVIALDER
ncbi:hypothetical protein [Halobaculum sp. EA56]|uniref:hypothetical protein n=1 Tax=Halobaculum sp. EA56 TaxID=3421648 RepID=UPI003EBF7690